MNRHGAYLRSHFEEHIARNAGTRNKYDTCDKLLIADSIVFGVATTRTAAADLKLWAVGHETGRITRALSLTPRLSVRDVTDAYGPHAGGMESRGL